MGEIRQNISANILKYRKLLDMTQKELADRLGVKATTVSTWERGANAPDIELLFKMCDIFGISVAEMYGTDTASNVFPIHSDNFEATDLKELYQPTHRIPILGRVAAGLPLLAEQHIEGYTLTTLNGGAEYFALRVHGDSMNAAMIPDNSVVIVRKQDIVENGQIAVVMVDLEDATVKRYRQDGNIVMLLPQSNNPVHQPQVYDLTETKIDILGLVVECKIEIQ